MENLVGRKVLCTNSFRGITRGKKYEIVKCNEETFTIVEDNGCEQPWSREHLATEVHLKLTLDEWQPKQGEKVSIKDENYNCDGLFVCTYNGYYLVEHNGTILSTKTLKPYKDEIKVGDWVKNTDEKELILVTKDMNLECLNNECEYIKIINPQLIILLNNEL